MTPESILISIISNKFKFLFIGAVILFIILNKKKFEVQAKVIFLLRTKVGLKFINGCGDKFKEYWKLFGYMGIGVGFIGMIFIFGFIVLNIVQLFLEPNAPSAVAPVIPGVQVPGSPIFVPFWYGIIALFVVTTVHEAAHGLVSRAHKIKVLNTGIVFFGPLMGAFVEPDEKKLQKEKDIVKYSIFAAGPFSNVVLALLALLLVAIISPMQGALVATDGYSFNQITPFLPAFNASVPDKVMFTHLNGIKIDSDDQFFEILGEVGPGDTVTVSNSEKPELSYSFEAIPNPNLADPKYAANNPDAPKVLVGLSGDSKGNILSIHKSDKLKVDNVLNSTLFRAFSILIELLFWIYVLSFGIGIANLLPLGPVDGGRMLQTFLFNVREKKSALSLWSKISYFTFVIIIILFIFPILRAVFGKFI